jgi:hypothetical protein
LGKPRLFGRRPADGQHPALCRRHTPPASLHELAAGSGANEAGNRLQSRAPAGGLSGRAHPLARDGGQRPGFQRRAEPSRRGARRLLRPALLGGAMPILALSCLRKPHRHRVERRWTGHHRRGLGGGLRNRDRRLLSGDSHEAGGGAPRGFVSSQSARPPIRRRPAALRPNPVHLS